MTQINFQTHPEALRTREPLALESSPDRLSVRVKVYNAVMQRDISGLPQDNDPSEGSTTLQNSSSPPSSRRKKVSYPHSPSESELRVGTVPRSKVRDHRTSPATVHGDSGLF